MAERGSMERWEIYMYYSTAVLLVLGVVYFYALSLTTFLVLLVAALGVTKLRIMFYSRRR